MEYVLIALVALGAALLTFFSGFGLGTILMPVFALFFPVEIAIALTAIVHLTNNLFKTGLIWRSINFKVVLLFALPAALAAFFGAILLDWISQNQVIILVYQIGDMVFRITLLKIIIAALLILFAVVEISKKLANFSLPKKYLPLGGLLSGFFGGLSGHQGALRSIFLLKAGLGKEGYIATGIAAAVLIDISRLSVYGASFFAKHLQKVSEDKTILLIIVACLAAFTGSFFGRKILKKITLPAIHLIVGMMILLFGLLLGFGLI
ncbi:MAG: sulfite exporter TauE/SafE family protein [Candidatus Moranbacteria bacterium]|nr:sulfite exporter TauE/SafE family protein [Candidatus Moranbacteria bacterium]